MQDNQKKNLNFITRCIFIIFTLLLASVFASGQDTEFSLRYLAKGTGRTTGHIVTLFAYNPTSNAVTIEIGNCFIPSNNRSQGYIIPGSTPLLIPPLKSISVSLEGYCINMDRNPVFFGDDIPPIEKWISWSDGNSLPVEGAEIPQAFKRVSGMSDDEFILTWPNSTTPFNYTLDVNRNPKEAVRLLLHYAESARRAVDMLAEEGRINVGPEMHESLVQQVLWMHVSRLEGKKYSRDVFMKKYLQEWQQNKNQLSEEMPLIVGAEAANIWESISLVGAEAKIIPVGISVSENLFREIPEGSEIPMRTTIIEMLNKSDFRSAETGDILIPALYHMQDKKDDPGWTSLWSAILGEWQKWLDHRTALIKPGGSGTLEELLGLNTKIKHEGKYFLSLTDQEKYNTAINRKLAEEIQSQIVSLDPKDPDYVTKWRTMHSWLDAEWYRDCCSTARPLDALPDKFPANLKPNPSAKTAAVDGPGWKYTPPPVIFTKGKVPWIIPAVGIPVAGVGTWLLLRDRNGKDTTDITIPVAVTDIITIPCDGEGSLNLLTNDSGQGIRLVAVQSPSQVSIEFTTNGHVVLSGTGPIGVFNASYTIEDQNGKTATAEIIITVIDSKKPTIQCPANTSVPFGSSTDPAVTGAVTASDNCTPTPQINISFTDQTTGTGCAQVITRTWTATDLAGNQSTCKQLITFQDEEPPVITCPQNTSVPFGSSTDPAVTGTATASDNCTPTPQINITFTDQATGTGCAQVITRTWTATDLAGNQSTCTQLITYQDDEPPVIECPADMEVDCSEYKDTAVTGVALAEDNCTADVALSFVNYPAEYSGCSMAITRTWTATDQAGNTSSCEQSLMVTDGTDPIITFCPPAITVECGDQENLDITGRPEVEDACNDLGEPSFADETVHFDGCTGMIIRTFTIGDGCGNTAVCTQEITITDTQAPVISCPIGLDVQCGQENDLNYTGIAIAEDNCHGVITPEYSDDLSNFIACDGFITRTFYATDQCGNTSSCTQQIFIENIPCSFVPIFNVVNDVCSRCFGYTEVSVNPPEDFTYLWSNGSTESGIYGLCSGIYTVTITNTADACSDIYTVEVPNDEQLLLVVLQVNNPSSETSSDGSVSLQVQSSGALPPFMVFINGLAIGTANSPTFQIINMPMGEYVIYVIDSGGAGCQSNDVFVFLFPGTAGLEYKPINMSLIPDMPSYYPVSIFSDQYEMPDQEPYQLLLTDRLQIPYGLSALFPIGQNYYIRTRLHRVTGIAGLYSGSQMLETGNFTDEMIGAGLRQMIPIGNTVHAFHESLFGARQYSFNSSGLNLTDRNMLFEYSAGLHWPVNESVRLELSGRLSINYFRDITDYSFYGGLRVTHDLTKLKTGIKTGEQISFPAKVPGLMNFIR
jgi:hypothetical protein